MLPAYHLVTLVCRTLAEQVVPSQTLSSMLWFLEFLGEVGHLRAAFSLYSTGLRQGLEGQDSH